MESEKLLEILIEEAKHNLDMRTYSEGSDMERCVLRIVSDLFRDALHRISMEKQEKDGYNF